MKLCGFCAFARDSLGGTYLILAVTGSRPDGSPFYIAWIGLNIPADGWVLIIDYRVPRGPGHPTADEADIWNHFLQDTKPLP